MMSIDYHVQNAIAPYINCIMIQESKDPDAILSLPFYADGYPGILFQFSENGMFLMPKGKPLSKLFLYGQTIEPISLHVKGPFYFIVFQLYPFASKYLLGVDPKILNDDCYDLMEQHPEYMVGIIERIQAAGTTMDKVRVISEMIEWLLRNQNHQKDDRIQQSIQLILDSKGTDKMRNIASQLHVTERTLERLFLSEVGLTPKQFARIIQFQSSLSQLNNKTYQQLMDVGFENGFTDQSHFIRTFKSYTGQTPSYYLKNYSKH